MNDDIDEAVDLDTLRPELTLVKSLKGTFYKYYELYNSWVEDRKEAASQAAEMDEHIQHFKKQVETLSQLEPSLCQYIGNHIREATAHATQSIGETLGQQAVGATESVTQRLTKAVEEAEQALRQYKRETRWHPWVVIGVSVIATVATCLLLVKWLMPQPMLPLTRTQLSNLWTGEIMADVWPQLSEIDKKRLRDMVNKAGYVFPK